MAPRKLSQLPVATEVAELDKLLITDVSDLTSGAAGTSKQLTALNLATWLLTNFFNAVYAPIGHTHSFSSLTDKPTTLAGYGITDGGGGGGGGSGMAIDGLITGATAGRLLYVGIGGVLAQHAGLSYDDSISTLEVSGSNNFIFRVTGTGGNYLNINPNGTISTGTVGTTFMSNGVSAWASVTAGSFSLQGDVNLARDAANILAMRNGANPQSFRLYNTFADSSNYERVTVGWVSNVFTISSGSAGTGTPRPISLVWGTNSLTIPSSFGPGFDLNFGPSGSIFRVLELGGVYGGADIYFLGYVPIGNGNTVLENYGGLGVVLSVRGIASPIRGYINMAETFRFDANATAGNTRFMLYDVDSGTLQRVKVGANASGPGGVGRALYIDDV